MTDLMAEAAAWMALVAVYGAVRPCLLDTCFEAPAESSTVARSLYNPDRCRKMLRQEGTGLEMPW